MARAQVTCRLFASVSSNGGTAGRLQEQVGRCPRGRPAPATLPRRRPPSRPQQTDAVGRQRPPTTDARLPRWRRRPSSSRPLATPPPAAAARRRGPAPAARLRASTSGSPAITAGTVTGTSGSADTGTAATAATWVAGHWERRPRGHVWIEGRWELSGRARRRARIVVTRERVPRRATACAPASALLASRLSPLSSGQRDELLDVRHERDLDAPVLRRGSARRCSAPPDRTRRSRPR